MIKNILIVLVTIMVITGCNNNPESKEEKSELQKEMENYDIPGLAYAVIKNGDVIVEEYEGVTKKGTDNEITEDTRFHIGSNGKTMTALLAAISVEADEIEWDDTIGEILVSDKYTITDNYRDITLDQLLSHTSGVPMLHGTTSWDSYFNNTEATDVQRVRMINELFKLDLAFTPGTSYKYTNIGIVIAAAMIEEVTNKTWEVLIQERVFTPLEMDNTGIGHPLLVDDSHTWGHNPNPVDPNSKYADNPRGIAPAGNVNSTIPDLIKYSNVWLNEGAPLIQTETFNYMLQERYSDANTSEALPWTLLDFDIGKVITHDGSNTMNYASLLYIPETDSGVIVLTNTINGKEFNPELINLMIMTHFVE